MERSNAGHSQWARNWMLIFPLALYVLYLMLFWAFVFYIFWSSHIDMKDATVVGLLTSVVNQGFSAMLLMVQFIYFREQAAPPRLPFRKDDPPNPGHAKDDPHHPEK